MAIFKEFVITVVLCSSVLFSIAVAHVALTYPPARNIDLDFLDNARTKGPCGMPRGMCNYFYYSVFC